MPRIAMAALREMLERSAHCIERARLAPELGGSRERERLHIGTRSLTVMPEREQHPYFFERETKISSAADEPQRVDVALVIVAVAGIAPRRGRNEADLLIVSDHPLADARCGRGLTDLHRRTPRNRREFPITVTELSDIAAPAMIGESRIRNQG